MSETADHANGSDLSSSGVEREQFGRMHVTSSVKTNPHVGSSFDDFLREEGIFESVDASAKKHVFVYDLRDQMKRRRISRTKLAARMGISRVGVDRLLDRRYRSVTLATMNRAAHAVGLELRISLVKV